MTKTTTTVARIALLAALAGSLAACTTAGPATTGSTYAAKNTQTTKAKDCSQFANNRAGLRRASDVAEIPVGVGNLMSTLGVSNRIASAGYRAKSAAYSTQRINRGSAALANC